MFISKEKQGQFLLNDDRTEITYKNQSIFQITLMLKITFRQFYRSLIEAYNTD